MQTREIDIDKLNASDLKYNQRGVSFYVIDGQMHKLFMNKDHELVISLKEIARINKALDMIGDTDLNQIQGACSPFEKLSYKRQIVGYLTFFLENFDHLDIALANLNAHQKIDLLKYTSETVASMHQINLVHGDLHADNILSNGLTTKIIDFDQSYLLNFGMMIEARRSPYIDIAYINDLIYRLLVKETEKGYADISTLRLPKDIKKYMNMYCVANWFSNSKTIVARRPKEYPHDWLDELKKYIDEDGYLASKNKSL